ncbi:hypothetical protein JZU48_05085, partial [bacterium]|nr:hypothetical protein [bacterium]
AVRARYEQKCEADVAEIHGRIAEVEIGRGYRIVGAIESIAKEVEGELIPMIQAALLRWRRAVLWADAAWAVLLGAAAVGVGRLLGVDGVASLWGWFSETPPDLGGVVPLRLAAAICGFLAVFLAGTLSTARRRRATNGGATAGTHG